MQPETAPDDSDRAKAFLDIAMDVFKISDATARENKRFRKIASVVGVKVLGLKPILLAPYLGITNGGVSFNAKNKNNNYPDEIKKLTEAIKGASNV